MSKTSCSSPYVLSQNYIWEILQKWDSKNSTLVLSYLKSLYDFCVYWVLWQTFKTYIKNKKLS